MNTKTLFTTALVLLAVSASAATAADKKSTERQSQYRIKDQAAVANINTKAAARIDLPAAASGLSGVNAIKPRIGLPPTAADRLGHIGAAAAAAEQARGLREAQQAVKEMANLQNVKNLGDINNLDGLIGRQNSNNPLDGLGNRPRGHGRPDYIKDNPYGPSNTHDDGSNQYTGGWAMPPSPRDTARGGGLASNNGGRSWYDGNTHFHSSWKYHSDGSTSNTVTVYDRNTGHFRSSSTQHYDSAGHVTGGSVLQRTGTIVDYEDGSVEILVSETRYNADGDVVFVNPGRVLGGDKFDPPTTDPVGIPNPYASGDPGPCRLPDTYCEAETDRKANTLRNPTLINPGDPDLAQGIPAPQLAIDTQGLVTNPTTGGYAGGGFNPPPGWQPGENSTPGAHPGPGGMPPRPGSKP